MKHIIRSAAGALAAGMIAAGCSSTPSASDQAAADTAIGNAGQAIDRAAGDPHVAKYASSELERANDSLGQAKTVWSDKHDLHATTHFAYLAQQRAATAQELANERAAEETIAAAAARRDRAVAMAGEARTSTQRLTATQQGQETLSGFASGKATVPPKAMPAIDELVATLKNNTRAKVVIEGHTDSVGSPQYNQGLAMERARAVRAALLRHGIDADRIDIRALGEQNPVASNDTSAGRRENRRVQVVIADTQESMVGSSQGTTATTSSGQGAQAGQNAQNAQNTQNAQNGQRRQ